MSLRRLSLHSPAIAFGAFALIIALYDTSQVMQASRSVNWPTAEAEIEEVDTQAIGAQDRVVLPQADYRYMVEGNEYRGSRVAFGVPDDAESLLAELEVGETVTIHYRARNPERSVVFAGTDHWLWWRTIGAWVLAVVMLGVGIVLARRRRRAAAG